MRGVVLRVFVGSSCGRLWWYSCLALWGVVRVCVCVDPTFLSSCRELVTKDNYNRYLKIAAPMAALQVKADFSLKTVGQQQVYRCRCLSVSPPSFPLALALSLARSLSLDIYVCVCVCVFVKADFSLKTVGQQQV